MINQGTVYTDINGQTPKYAPAQAKASDKPTRNKGGKVYFKTAGGTVVECDLSPGARFEDIGNGYRKLTDGHIRIKCPTEGAHDNHVNHDNKTVLVSTTKTIEYIDSEGGVWLLPTLTVLETLWCNYREGEEHTGAGCRWAAKIADGVAYDVDHTIHGKSSGIIMAVR